jgi:hypothetical protein
MDQKQRQILKTYIKKILLESEVLDMEMPGETALTYELNKGYNRALPIGPEELSKIKEAIKFRHPNVSSVDVNNNEITFDKQGNPNNFHIVIRKVAVPQNRSQYKYIMWYVPFTEREDIDKPGMVHKKEGPLFDRSIDKTKLLDDIYEFFTKALLMN